MTTFSIALPDSLAKASQIAAERLQLSRVQFIRQAIAHELENLEKQFKQEAMVKSIEAMKQSPEYIAESRKIETGFGNDLPEDDTKW